MNKTPKGSAGFLSQVPAKGKTKTGSRESGQLKELRSP